MIDIDLYPYIPRLYDKFNMTLNMTRDELNFNSIIDYDLFYSYLADIIATIPPLVTYVEQNYEANKFIYYNKATNSPQYNATLMTDGTIKREATNKRALGMLLAAQEDDKLQLEICDLFISVYPPLRKLKKPFSKDLYLKLRADFNAMIWKTNWQKEALRAYVFLAAYIIDHYHGLNGNKNIAVVISKLCVISYVLMGESFDRESFKKQTELINPRNYIRTPADFRDFKPLVSTNSDVLNAISILRMFEDSEYEDDLQHDQRFSSLYSYLTSPDKKATQTKIQVLLRNLIDVVTLAGKNLEMLISQQTISEEELDLLYKIVSKNYQFEKTRPNELIPIQPSDYLHAITIYQIIKALKSDAEFYYKNSAESQFYETRSAEKENEILKNQLASKNNEIDVLQQQVSSLSSQIDALKVELLKDTKDATRDATKPLLAEISTLNTQVADLHSKVAESSLLQSELYHLRNFIFEMHSVGDIEVEEVDLSKLINGKRIYVFGGHINWRNKLKQKYPKLDVLDGHITSFDAQKLVDADMVLLNTSNMSHDLYCKVIDVLRKHNVPFDYLGKYSNPNLLEKEISEVLIRH